MTAHTVTRVLRVASVVVALVLAAARVDASLIETSSFETASIGTWELTGTITRVDGRLTNYLSAGMPVTLDLFADPNEPFTPATGCPNPAESGFWHVDSNLQAGPFTWAGSGVIERHNESGFCGAVGLPLDLMAFDLALVSAPPVPNPFAFSLFQLYVALGAASLIDPGSPAPPTLGQQLDVVKFGDGIATTRGAGNLLFVGPVAPVPEPATWILLATGGAGAVGMRRRTRRNRQPPVSLE